MKLQKWLNWEFWPWRFFYIPVYVYGFWLGLKSGALSFFVATNPKMKFGGLFGMSKSEVLNHFDAEFVPLNVLVKKGETAGALEMIEQAGITYPLIAKPDVGERGREVKLVKDKAILLDYLEGSKDDIIIQEYIDYPIELGVLYVRMPGEDKGKITSIVRKDFPHIMGDGKTTVRELIRTDARGKYYFELLCKEFEPELDKVLAKGEIKRLVFIGNHVRGTTFLNANHLINPKLEAVFNKLSQQQPEFYIGRYDLRAKSIDDLENGKNFKLMELNGVNSEPAHIYDPKMPLLKAYRDLLGHWTTIYKVSKANHKRGVPYGKALQVIKALRKHGE